MSISAALGEGYALRTETVRGPVGKVTAALLELKIVDAGFAAHADRDVEMIGHETIGHNLHTAESSLLPEQLVQLPLAQIIEQELTATIRQIQ